MLFFILSFGTLYAQGQLRVEGTIKNLQGERVEGVTIFVEGTFNETDSDANGEFQLEIQKNASKMFTIIAEKNGYDAIFQEVTYEDDDEEITVDLFFMNQTQNLQEVVVTGNRSVTEVKPVSTESIGFVDVLANSAQLDVISSLSSISGTQQVGETGELSVRGGTGAETQYLFDGMILRNQLQTSPQNQGSRLRFSPQLFKNFEFYAGGYSAEYGQALSSILVMESSDIPLEKGLSVVVSPFFLDVTDKRHIGKNQSLEINANVQDFSIYTDFIEPDISYQRLERGPRSISGSLFYKYKISDKAFFKLFSYGYAAKITSLLDNIDDSNFVEKSNIDNVNSYNLASLRYKVSPKSDLKLGMSFGYNKDGIQTNFLEGTDYVEGIPRERATTDIHAKAKFSSEISPTFVINTGTEFFNQRSKFSTDASSRTIGDNLLAIYSEGRLKLAKNVFTTLGTRYEYSWLTNRGNIAPRYDLTYDNSKTKVNFSYGDFYQQTSLDNLLVNTDLNYLKANHFILSMERQYLRHVLKLDLFNKNYKRLIRSNENILNTDGNGYARGIDASLKGQKIFGKYTYQLGYSFLDSERLHLNFPVAAPVRFAAKHTASFMVNRSFMDEKFTVSLNYQYNSGRPYFNPNRTENDFNRDITPDFHDLSANFFYTVKIKNTPLLFLASLSNVFGNEQTYGYEYSDLNQNLRRPIRSLYNRFLFVGCYIPLGSDNSKDYIDELINN